jgi:hypothetical protein
LRSPHFPSALPDVSVNVNMPPGRVMVSASGKF